MSSQPITGMTPTLRCPRCKNPFKMPLDKLGLVGKCKSCECRFRVDQDEDDEFVVQVAELKPPPLPSQKQNSVIKAELDEDDPTVMGKRTNGKPSRSDDDEDDRTVMGKRTNGKRSRSDDDGDDRTVMGKRTDGKPSRSDDEDDPTLMGKQNNAKPLSLDDDDDSTVMGKARPRSHTPLRAKPRPKPGVARSRSSKSTILLIVAAVIFLGGLSVGGYYAFRKKPESTAGSEVSLGKYGGIEIGSTGVKMVALEYFNTDEGVKPKLLMNEPIDVNTFLGKNVKKTDKDFDPVILRKTLDQVADYHRRLKDEFNIPSDNIYIACSSGVLSNFAEDNKSRNEKALTDEIVKKTGKTPQFLSAHEEGLFAFQAIVPKPDWDKALVIDIGGNNIKGGLFRRGNFHDLEVGIDQYGKNIKDRPPIEQPYDAAQRCAYLITQPLAKEIEQNPDLTSRKKIYFIGGIPWTMATYTRTEEYYSLPSGRKGVYVRPLSVKDFTTFAELIRIKTPEEIKKDIQNRIQGKGEWANLAMENVDKIQIEVFKKPEPLHAGARVLLCLADQLKLENPDKELYSYRFGHVAWLIGYIGSKSGHSPR